MWRFLAAVLVVTVVGSGANAGVIVVANSTPNPISFTVTEPDQKSRTLMIAGGQVSPISVTGPIDVVFASKPPANLKLDPYHAYIFLADEKTGLRLEGIELPGNPPERDARPELNPIRRDILKIPVTLMVDDADPRAEKLWQQTLRARFDEAAAVVEAHAGVRFEFAGFSTWRSDPTIHDVPGLLTDFEDKVKVKPGQMVIGYTSRKVEEKEKEQSPLGACHGIPSQHILLREWRLRVEADKVEVMIQHMGLALGATYCPTPWSVMRPELGDGLTTNPKYQPRFDPLNTLAMNIWADEMRRGPIVSIAEVPALTKIRLGRIYKTLLKARPGDSLSLTYLNEFDRGVIAKIPEPKNLDQKNPVDPAPMAKKDPPAPQKNPRDEVARAVVRAITLAARANFGPSALSGDELTAIYVQAAAEASLRVDATIDEEPRIAGFLIGLGIGLDDTDSIRNDPVGGAIAKEVESDADNDQRIALLGNPTILGRRDICRRFALGCALGEIHKADKAEELALERAIGRQALQRATGISFAALCAEFAGVEFGRSLRGLPRGLQTFARKAHPNNWVPATTGLRDGLSPERFEDDYGDSTDPRFKAVINNIRSRLKKLDILKP